MEKTEANVFKSCISPNLILYFDNVLVILAEVWGIFAGAKWLKMDEVVQNHQLEIQKLFQSLYFKGHENMLLSSQMENHIF